MTAPWSPYGPPLPKNEASPKLKNEPFFIEKQSPLRETIPWKKIQISKTAINICFTYKTTMENNEIICSLRLL